MANQRHLEYRAHCSLDSIRLNVFEAVALPIREDMMPICYKDPRNCATQSKFGSSIELTP